jgi:hypothetical protein
MGRGGAGPPSPPGIELLLLHLWDMGCGHPEYSIPGLRAHRRQGLLPQLLPLSGCVFSELWGSSGCGAAPGALPSAQEALHYPPQKTWADQSCGSQRFSFGLNGTPNPLCP